jgi:hypothetical protein
MQMRVIPFPYRALSVYTRLGHFIIFSARQEAHRTPTGLLLYAHGMSVNIMLIGTICGQIFMVADYSSRSLPASQIWVIVAFLETKLMRHDTTPR